MTIRFVEISEPATPPSGKVWLYVDTADSKVKTKDDTGTVTIFQPGADGADGADGKTLLNGTVAPTIEGVNGDFYINTVLNLIHGPKAAGTWPSGVSLVGPTGATGATGPAGPGSAGAEGDGSYFFTNTASDLGGGKLEMIREIPAGGGASVVGTSVSNGDILVEFASLAGLPNATYLPSGVLSFHTMARQLAGTQTSKLYAEFYSRTTLAVETLIGTTPVSDALTGTSAMVSGQVEVPVTRGLSLTDRIVVRIKAEVTGVGTAPEIHVEFQGLNNSRCRFPFEVVRTKADLGLSDVDNTSDADKPVSTDTQTALDLKADLAGTASRVAYYNGSNELDAKSNWSINADDGIDLGQTVVPVAGTAYKKLNNNYFQAAPSANSEENWYQFWYEPSISATGFQMGTPATGQGGINGIGMAATANDDFGYIRNFDFSITAMTGVTGHTVTAMNQYINVQSGATVKNVYGIPVSIGGQGDVEFAMGFSANANFEAVSNGFIGFNLGGNIDFAAPPTGTYFQGVNINPTVTGVENATGVSVYMGNVTAVNTPLAGSFTGNVFIDGDLQLTGAFGFSGDLTIGSVSSFKQQNVINGGGNPTTNNGIVSQFDGTGTVANCDMIGLSTPALITLGATFAGTSGPFGLGIASLALPNVVTMNAGCTLDNLTACAYVTLFDAANTGGTIDRLINVRATNIPQGGTQTVTRSYSFFADFFAGDVAVDSWGVYDSGAKYNWMANSLKVGGTDTTAHAFEVDGAVLLDGNLGFYGTTPIAQPASSGAATAGGTWTSTEQTMLQEVYNAARALGIMS